MFSVHVSAIAWLHLMDANKTPKERATWELHKDAACYFEQILEVASYKTAPVQPFTSHLSNHPRCARYAGKVSTNS